MILSLLSNQSAVGVGQVVKVQRIYDVITVEVTYQGAVALTALTVEVRGSLVSRTAGSLQRIVLVPVVFTAAELTARYATRTTSTTVPICWLFVNAAVTVMTGVGDVTCIIASKD